jgi:hypothetical protein
MEWVLFVSLFTIISLLVRIKIELAQIRADTKLIAAVVFSRSKGD